MSAAPETILIGGRAVRMELINGIGRPDDVLHSLCHWFADAPTGDQTDPPACRIAIGLARVMRDNPALARWLLESFASQPQQGEFNGTKVTPATA